MAGGKTSMQWTVMRCRAAAVTGEEVLVVVVWVLVEVVVVPVAVVEVLVEVLLVVVCVVLVEVRVELVRLGFTMSSMLVARKLRPCVLRQPL
mmetsp:Transcript_37103/g.103249  ORF Transcript_37103/g.103249 Transcript_37103/m.103249 type:complete len:92 (+) Transcript_37103:661-936(+)